MHKSSFLLLLLALSPWPRPGEAGSLEPSVPFGLVDPSVPGELTRAWLRFHAAGLCEGVDAVFSFSRTGMEVWSRVEDEKSYGKFQEMLKPLSSAYRIELYATYPEREKAPKENSEEDGDADEEDNPPPSLWENYELRSFLGDPIARMMEQSSHQEKRAHLVPPSDLLRSRLFLYAERLLSLNRRLQRQASELPSLAQLAADEGAAAELKIEAGRVCLEHARGMRESIKKIHSQLKPAFPRADKQGKKSETARFPLGGATSLQAAERLAQAVAETTIRVDRFLYPEKYTVSLDDLRQPSLLSSLQELEKMDSEYLKALEKSKQQ